jgi:undecaprenyl diphosphate synthase
MKPQHLRPLDNPPKDGNLPRHVAIIMDGNGRWAKDRGLPRVAGHKAGAKSVKKIVQACVEKGIQHLTLFTFSSENWRRPEKEVKLLLELFVSALDKEIKKLHKKNVKFQAIGDISAFDEKIKKSIKDAETLTKNNTNLTLTTAVNYGGQWDITEACKKIAIAVKNGNINPDHINTELLEKNICLSNLPAPDLFIRTGGEKRISNFLLWQLAYTELFFSDVLWPDFDEIAFDKAIESFVTRQRRFGQTSEQVEAAQNV